MAEVLVEYQDHFPAHDDAYYLARVCGRPMEDGLWEGWIEFTPVAGGDAVATGQETTQPNRDDLLYWATGLTFAYLEGALDRALEPAPTPQGHGTVHARPAFSGPVRHARRPTPGVPAQAVLDPFAVYRQSGDAILRGQLAALDADRLRTIVATHALSSAPSGELQLLSKSVLIDLIASAVAAKSA